MLVALAVALSGVEREHWDGVQDMRTFFDRSQRLFSIAPGIPGRHAPCVCRLRKPSPFGVPSFMDSIVNKSTKSSPGNISVWNVKEEETAANVKKIVKDKSDDSDKKIAHLGLSDLAANLKGSYLLGRAARIPEFPEMFSYDNRLHSLRLRRAMLRSIEETENQLTAQAACVLDDCNFGNPFLPS